MSQDLQINWLYEQYGFSDIETFTLHPLNNQKNVLCIIVISIVVFPYISNYHICPF